MNYNNLLTQKIYTLLEPLVGSSMAKATLKVQFQKLGISEESLGIKDLQNLANLIEKGLTVFLGSETARGISLNIAKMA